MKPERWNDLLLAYLTGTLSAADGAAFEQMVAECDPCHEELREWQTLADAVRAESEARSSALPPLSETFYRRLTAQPSANGSHARSVTATEEMMTTITGQIGQKTYPRLSTQPLTLAAAVVAALVLGALLLFAGGRGPSDDLPSAGIVGQETTETPTATNTFEPTPSLTFTPTPMASPTLVPGEPQFTATPLRMESPVMPVPPTLMPAEQSAMEPIVSAPAQLNASIELPEGTGAAQVLLSRDGNVAAVLGLEGTVYLFNTATQQPVKQFAPSNSVITAMAYDSNRNLLALGSADGELYLLDTNTGTQESVMDGDGTVTALAFSQNNSQWLAIVRNGGTLNTVWLYDQDSGEQTAILVFDLPLTNAVFSADGAQMIVGTLDGRVLVLDVNQD
ncbi:MAG: hypothetical protein HZC41_14550 [Chloroflexi bacterium]|nr:hypothetical protein [Chloroflexota bacterium]